ncbi:uid family transcriptional regulator [Xanthomonas bromi]|uniref:Uid family transcriptional regulator n=1 Tax=Xanthomonas bromi TaxID=56449 RepID=A0A1C3NRX0_9XANT|nr:uid family transcriptional regulator [Xanthomonas bromi]
MSHSRREQLVDHASVCFTPPADRSPMSNVLQLRTAKQREEILVGDVLDAAERCIDEIGLSATSFELIAEPTRLSCDSLLQRFEDKDALVRALLERNYMRAIGQMWLVERPANVHVVDVIAGLLDHGLLQEINIKRTRIDLALHLPTLRDPVLATFMRRQSTSLIEHLSALLKRLRCGHTDTASSEQEFQARVFAVYAMCGGLHNVMTSGMELNRMAPSADLAREPFGHPHVGAGVILTQHLLGDYRKRHSTCQHGGSLCRRRGGLLPCTGSGCLQEPGNQTVRTVVRSARCLPQFRRQTGTLHRHKVEQILGQCQTLAFVHGRTRRIGVRSGHHVDRLIQAGRRCSQLACPLLPRRRYVVPPALRFHVARGHHVGQSHPQECDQRPHRLAATHHSKIFVIGVILEITVCRRGRRFDCRKTPAYCGPSGAQICHRSPRIGEVDATRRARRPERRFANDPPWQALDKLRIGVRVAVRCRRAGVCHGRAILLLAPGASARDGRQR